MALFVQTAGRQETDRPRLARFFLPTWPALALFCLRTQAIALQVISLVALTPPLPCLSLPPANLYRHSLPKSLPSSWSSVSVSSPRAAGSNRLVKPSLPLTGRKVTRVEGGATGADEFAGNQPSISFAGPCGCDGSRSSRLLRRRTSSCFTLNPARESRVPFVRKTED